MFSELLLDLVNEHARVKKGKIRLNEAPFVTPELCKAKLRKNANKSHFQENCDGGSKK